MKKLIDNSHFKNILIAVFFIALMVVPYFVFAEGRESLEDGYRYTNDATGGSNNPLDRVTGVASDSSYDTAIGEDSLGYVVSNVINGFLSILGVIFLALIIYGGFLWMTAQGNDEQVTKAKGLIRNAIIGMIIVIAAYAITYFVLDAVLEEGGRGGGGGTS